jgi:protein associated with RNAse G/E
VKVGEQIQIRAYKADGTCYRRWHATVESVAEHRVIVVTPACHRVEGIDGGWTSEYAIRAFYWIDRWYSLLEVYTPEGRIEEIYVNIGSPAKIEDSALTFTDYELDVSRRPPLGARMEDEEEFREAATRYGYTQAFQRACYGVARKAVDLANNWEPKGMPTFKAIGGQENEEVVP